MLCDAVSLVLYGWLFMTVEVVGERGRWCAV